MQNALGAVAAPSWASGSPQFAVAAADASFVGAVEEIGYRVCILTAAAGCQCRAMSLGLAVTTDDGDWVLSVGVGEFAVSAVQESEAASEIVRAGDDGEPEPEVGAGAASVAAAAGCGSAVTACEHVATVAGAAVLPAMLVPE